jgi:hypothetical protein
MYILTVRLALETSTMKAVAEIIGLQAIQIVKT